MQQLLNKCNYRIFSATATMIVTTYATSVETNAVTTETNIIDQHILNNCYTCFIKCYNSCNNICNNCWNNWSNYWTSAVVEYFTTTVAYCVATASYISAVIYFSLVFTFTIVTVIAIAKHMHQLLHLLLQ